MSRGFPARSALIPSGRPAAIRYGVLTGPPAGYLLFIFAWKSEGAAGTPTRLLYENRCACTMFLKSDDGAEDRRSSGGAMMASGQPGTCRSAG
jgi:hypothetical protein